MRQLLFVRSWHVLLAIVSILAGSFFASRASADTPVVTTTPVPEVTLAPPTTIPTVLPAATPTIIIPVKQEQSPPVVTVVAPPTEVPIPTLSVATPTVPVPTGTVAPAVPAVTPSPPDVPLPSPAQLEMNARLRWGDRVPASVRRWAFLIVPAAHRYHLDPNLIAAVMTMESNGDPLAWSSADARGLMQILHGPWDPGENVNEGARMLRHLLDEFGNLDMALAAYNAGEGAVLQYGGIPPYHETRDYVIVVHYLYDLFDHHHLSRTRTVRYKKTLTDLVHYKSQRAKVVHLAAIAHVRVSITDLDQCRHFSATCGTSASSSAQITDPFWPLTGQPDPLQTVSPPVP